MTHEHHDLSCREVVELVTDYLEGGLSDADRTRFEIHLVYCSGCDRYLDQMRGTIAAVGGSGPVAEPDDVPDELLEAFRGWKRQTREE
jgi:anti-sigma factor RsiW